MADVATATGYCLSDLLHTFLSDRDHLFQWLLILGGSCARAMRKISDPRAGPQPSQPKNLFSFQGVGVLAKINTSPTLKSIGEVLRARQVAANLHSAVSHKWRSADPPYSPLLAPKVREGLWAPRYPASRSAVEAEKSRRQRNGAQTPVLNTGQPAPHHLRFIVAGAVAGAWANSTRTLGLIIMQKDGNSSSLRKGAECYWVVPDARTWQR